MKKISLQLFLTFAAVFSLNAQNIDKFFKLMWTAEPGICTYRTNIMFENGQIILGTNGATSSQSDDAKDGVYLINAKTGKIEKQIQTGNADEDVNGVAVDGEKLFFGTDNKIFYCFDKKGKKLWEYKYQGLLEGRMGQFEGCPALADFNKDGIKDVVVNMEAVGTVALDGKSGQVLWSFIDTYCYSGCFMNSPGVYDFTGDGVRDVVVGARGDKFGFESWYHDYMVALDGTNGDTLWTYQYGSGMKSSPLIYVNKKNPTILMAETYSGVHFLDKTGKLQKYIDFTMEDGGISGLYSSPVISPDGIVVIGNAWWGEIDGVWFADTKTENFAPDPAGNKRLENQFRTYIKAGTVTATPVIADILGNGKLQTCFCTEGGEMLICEETGKELHRLKLNHSTETTPLIKDIDNDGFLEIVLASKTGTLSCYKTKSKGKVFFGQFRADNSNTGVLEF